MPFLDLQSYIRHLDKAGQLKRISVEVDPELEVTEIAIRSVREQGPALLFEQMKGSPYPLVINLFACMKRIEMALGMHPQELGEHLVRFAENMIPPTVGALWRSRTIVPRLLSARKRRARSAHCQEVIESPADLNSLPILKCWPDDGGRFLTFPLVITPDPQTGRTNMGIYRMHVHGKAETGMHMQIQKGVGFHYRKAEERGEPLEVAVVVGADPALMLAAVLPLPEDFEEVVFSGILRGKRTPMVPAKTLSMDVPASAEFIIEGVIPPRVRKDEGPFGDHFGHYSRKAPFPVFHINAITRRKSPVYPAAVVGRPPQEDRYLGDACQEMLKPLIKLMRPEVCDLWAYYQAGFHNLLVVSVESRYAKEPIKTALGILGEGQLSLTKCVVLVNPSVDVRSFGAVLRAIRENFAPKDDFILISRAPLDTLDFTGYKMHLGSKMIIDATTLRSVADEKTASASAGGAQGPSGSGASIPALKRDPSDIHPGVLKWRLLEDTLLVAQVEGDGREILVTLVSSNALSGVKIIALVSPDVNIEDDVDLIWGMFTRFDPARDILFSRISRRGALVEYGGVMGIDATYKEGYPDPLVMSEEIVEKVDRRWGEYWR
ncbi:MAG: UbiD family decarboxylase [Candidatus Latescibacteria bacterium]|nr:UbiD family decarboxylase [Candidatus Latescibacterota bacterium]NIM22688.1 UbiD family decarboxylase [Candidatus Latescibacterota bacterium]NIM64977.1 UbiD family decarboxylase [Candidatus Latescibacterota bacterium]NIO01492.1 UbiD family decarboxylase [Candidatus Latescibacterota bacterium]NIO28002.1 UbiD family decarboxylase [Candidatus Latescibacterota bacterium]